MIDIFLQGFWFSLGVSVSIGAVIVIVAFLLAAISVATKRIDE